jgi:hypothetical protein
MRTFVALALLATAGPAVAQEQAPKPAAKEERRPLNLKLDQPARLYVRETAPETPEGKAAAAENLPSLGGGAATLEKPSSEPRARTRTSPYPPDSENPR